MSATATPTMPRRRTFGREALPWHPLPTMEEYLQNLESEDRAVDYVRMVKVGLSHFAAFAADEGIRHPNEIQRMHILRYQAYLNTKTTAEGKLLEKSYKYRLMKYLRAWISWMEELDYLDASPWVRIKVGSVKKVSKALEQEEVHALFEAHRSQAFMIQPFHYHRREMILALFYTWGLRIHELHSLNVTQMDMRQDFVTVINKGGGTKSMPYGPELKMVVQRWLRLRAVNGQYGEDALLIDSEGKRLSMQMIRKIVTELGQRAGVAINPHRFRDTFGTTLFDNDVNVELIMKLMGHTQRSQTMAYTRVHDVKVAEAHQPIMGVLLNDLLFQRT